MKIQTVVEKKNIATNLYLWPKTEIDGSGMSATVHFKK
jgi:hypothetical protein